MTWLAWRQLRTQLLVAAVALLALVIVLINTGPYLLHVYDTAVVHCAQRHDCGPVGSQFQALGHLIHVFSTLVVVTPILFGVFLGAPLVARELETGTYRLAWTQSVTRLRWIVVRLVAVMIGVFVLTALLSVAVTWWSSPLDRYNDNPFGPFDARDVVPVAYAVFAVSLGALLGAVMRRTLAAMVATLAGFAAARYVVQQYVESNLVAPLQEIRHYRAPSVSANSIGYTITPPNPADWVLSDQTVNASGKVIGQYGGIGSNGSFGFNVRNNGSAVFSGVGPCPNRIPVPPGGVRAHPTPAQARATQAAIQRCVNSFHLREVITYQPTNHYWPLQWTEFGLFVAAAVALGAVCVWWVRRHLP